MMNNSEMCNEYGLEVWSKFVGKVINTRYSFRGTIEAEPGFFRPGLKPSECSVAKVEKLNRDVFVQEWTGDENQKGLSLPKW